MARETSFTLRVPPFLVLCLSYALTFAGAGALQQFVVPIARQRGWEEMKSYLPLIIIYFSFAFFRFLSGLYVKKLGLKTSLLLGSFTYTLFPLAFLLNLPYPILLLIMFIWGWGAAVYWTAGTVALLFLSRDKRYGSYSGFLYTSLNIGFAIGVALLGLIHSKLGENKMFAISFSLSLFGTSLLLLLPELEAEMEIHPPSLLVKLAFGEKSRLPGFYLFVSALTLGIMFGSFGEWISSLYGISYMTTITFIGYAGRIFLSYPGGWIADKFGERFALMLSLLLSVLGLGTALLFPSFFTYSFCALMLGSQMSIVPITATSLIGRRFPPQIYHLASGAILAWNSLGVAIALLLSAILQNILQNLPSVLFFFTIIFSICTLISLKKED
ncbi:MFS transporter [bacterium]|nr:MFS transporter [bacterium]